MRDWRLVSGVCLLLLILSAAAIPASPVMATGPMPNPAWQPTPVPTPQYVPTARPTSEPGTTPTATPTPDAPRPIVENIFHIIRFPFQTRLGSVCWPMPPG